MLTRLAAIVLAISTGAALYAQTKPVGTNDLLRLVVEVDGKVQTCEHTVVELGFGRKNIKAKMLPEGFLVPDAIQSLYADMETRFVANVSTHIECDELDLKFDGLYPGLVLPGSWAAGIARPDTWPKNWQHSSESGTWTSYLEAECDHCDPGIVMVVSHSEVPPGVTQKLLAEQPGASKKRERDIAFALAVYDQDRRKSTGFLLTLYKSCLARTEASLDENDPCDDDLFHELTNLYWRGDDSTLPILLDSAQSKSDVASSVGYFAGDLLDRRTRAAIEALGDLSKATQEAVCRMAAEDDLSMNGPRRERVTTKLRLLGGSVAELCLDQIARSKTY